MKRRAVRGILAALAALGAGLIMSQAVYAPSLPGPGSAHATARVTSPDEQDLVIVNSGSWAEAHAYMGDGSSGGAVDTADATTGTDSLARAIAVSTIDDNTSGQAVATASAAATNGSEAFAGADTYLGSGTDPTANAVADATATNDGLAEAQALAGVGDGGTGNITAYACANSTGAYASSVTDIETGTSTPAPGAYYQVYSSGDSVAFALLAVASNNIVGISYANAGSVNVGAAVIVGGSDITVVYAGPASPM